MLEGQYDKEKTVLEDSWSVSEILNLIEDQLLVSKEELVKDVTVSDRLDYHNLEAVMFKIFQALRKTSRKIVCRLEQT